jgi:hypothetical protein
MVTFMQPMRTDEEVAALRAEVQTFIGIDAFTCDDCPSRFVCEWAFEPYNTDGACLAEKWSIATRERRTVAVMTEYGARFRWLSKTWCAQNAARS